MHRSFIAGLVSLVFCLCTHGSLAGLSDGLIAYYPFEGNAHDASGNGHDGLEIGGLSYEGGIAGSCASFDGITAKIQVPHSDDLNLDGPFTLSCWIKSDKTSPASGLLAKIQSSSPRNGYVLTANAELLSADIRMNVNKSWPAVQGTVHSKNSALDGSWHHIVASYDEETLTLYLDGQIEMQLAYTNGLTVNAMPLYIGWDPYSWTRYFNGKMDEVRIYNRTLLSDEVADLYGDIHPSLHLFVEPLTNTLVVAGESFANTITVSNAGNADLEFSFCPPPGGEVGLVAYYPFEGNALDASGNGHDGLEMGSLSYGNGIAGSCASFDGKTAKIQVPHSDELNLDGPYTLSCWIKSTGTSPASGLLAKIQSSSPRNGCVLTANAEFLSADIRMHVNKSWPAVQGTVHSTNSALDGNWHHLVGTYDEETLTLYLDGQIEMQLAYTNGLTVNAMPLYIGWDPYSWSRYFNGEMDEVRIYNRALSDEEIARLAGQGADAGLVAYYPFTGNADDASGQGHDGTVLGAELTFDRFDHANSAYHFDGVDDFIDIGLFDAGIKAVSMWVRQGSRDEFDFYFGHNTFRLYASTLDNGRLMYGDGSPNKTYTSALMDDYVGEWVHLVVVGDGGNSKVYLNGVNVTESSGAVGPALASIVNLGRWPGPVPSASHYMQGDIDDVRVYDRILSEGEIRELYSEVPDAECAFPEWLTVVPAAGTVASQGSMDVSVVYNASNMIAGDYAEHVLKLMSNDPEYPELEAPVSMWVIPSVPEIQSEPLCTIGRSNVISWSYQEGPVEYWVEAMAVQHYAPYSGKGPGTTPRGWGMANLDAWRQQAGWISSTSCLLTDLRLNTIYMYRVKASVMTEIGRLEGDWSDWTSSCQVPVIPKSN